MADNILATTNQFVYKMITILKKCVRTVRHVPKLLFIDKHTREFIKHNKKVWRGWSNRNSDSVILVDFYPVSETLIAYSYFLNALARKNNAAIKVFSSLSGKLNIKTKKIYKSFNTTGHIITSLCKEQKLRMKAMAREIIPSLKKKKDVFDLTVLDIWIGIDIYESYLRRYSEPTIVLDDKRLIELIEEGIGLVIFWLDYFKRNSVAAVVISHDNYLEMNAVSKVAYYLKVPVYLPNVRGICYAKKPFSLYDYFGSYRQMFRKLSINEQRKGLALAKKQLELRFRGHVGVDIPYSTKSAFHSSRKGKKVVKSSENIKVLICTHCFYDNPHGYGEMLFLDFFEWLCFLGKISERTAYDWYIKVHPDYWPGTMKVVRKIIEMFPKITLIPHDVSHHQLVEEGIDFVLTAYGTVGHEYPALGIQVINAGYNFRIAYDFNWHPKSIEEYEHLLLNMDKLSKNIKLEDIYEFYYINHYYVCADDLIFKSYRQYLQDLTPEQRCGSTVYKYFLDQLTEEKHQENINNMQNFIDSGKTHYFRYGPE